ncbi:Glutamate-rich WD repeat-containing protein 1, partial [Halocaridina rubra]
SCTVNDVRLCATWSELGRVHIWNLENLWGTVNRDAQMGYVPTENDENEQLIYTFKGHTSEGFAVDWSIPSPGTLATGDCEKHIYVWKPQPGGTWIVEDKPFLAHTGSVEDIQWSPNEPHVFASCSVDKSIKIWDDRAKQNKACMITVSHAHTSDVNVIHWNRNDPFIVSGGDDGIVKIWDLRQLQVGYVKLS